MEENRFDYTAAVAELEDIAARVENPDTPLDDIAALVTRSKTLLQACRQYLRTVQQQMEALEENE